MASGDVSYPNAGSKVLQLLLTIAQSRMLTIETVPACLPSLHIPIYPCPLPNNFRLISDLPEFRHQRCGDKG